MVKEIPAKGKIDLILEYKSFMKKLTAYTLSELKAEYENHPKKNFQKRIDIRKSQMLEKLKLEEEEK